MDVDRYHKIRYGETHNNKIRPVREKCQILSTSVSLIVYIQHEHCDVVNCPEAAPNMLDCTVKTLKQSTIIEWMACILCWYFQQLRILFPTSQQAHDVRSTLMRRRRIDVASTLIWRHFNVMCLLGCFK